MEGLGAFFDGRNVAKPYSPTYKLSDLQLRYGGGEGIRTPGIRIMSPTLYL